MFVVVGRWLYGKLVWDSVLEELTKSKTAPRHPNFFFAQVLNIASDGEPRVVPHHADGGSVSEQVVVTPAMFVQKIKWGELVEARKQTTKTALSAGESSAAREMGGCNCSAGEQRSLEDILKLAKEFESNFVKRSFLAINDSVP